MPPITIDESSPQAAPKARLMSSEFRRLLALVKPHRRFIVLGLMAAVLHGLLHSVGIVTALPVMKILLTDEGVHGWSSRLVAEDRLDGSVVLRANDEEAAQHLVVGKMAKSGSLEASGLKPGDVIVEFRAMAVLPDAANSSANGSANSGPYGGKWRAVDSTQAFHTAVADAPEDGTMELRIKRSGQAPELVTVTLDDPSLWSTILRRMTTVLPAGDTPNSRLKTLAGFLCFVVVVVILSSIARYIATMLLSLGVLRGVMDLRKRLYRKVLRLPMTFFAENTSDIVTRFVQDAQEIQRGLLALFGKLLTEPIKAAFLLGAALWIDARMTLTMLAIAPLALALFWVIGRKTRKATKRLLKVYGLMMGALSTTLGAIGIVKAYNAEDMERRRLWKVDRVMFKHQYRLVQLEAFLRPLLEVLGVIGIAAATLWLGAGVIRHEIRIEEFGTLVLALGMLIDPLRKLADVYPRVMRSAAGAARVFAVEDAPEEKELLEGAVKLGPLKNAIEFKNVTFTYPNAESPALRDVTLAIHQGETVAVVGPNGSGKTTLTRLLIRFFDPEAGHIYYDGHDVGAVRLRSLRRQFAVVTQDPAVFAMTIAENIAYGRRNVVREEVIEAAQKAYADDFIQSKKDGYDERVGEGGGMLSGGQRQRICIARAILRDAPVLIFDEATSQIDSESEAQIQKAIRDFAVGRTTIIVAHRLSTIRFAQRVVVMDQGRVLDTGSHEELMSRCDLYAALVRTQFAE